MVKENMHKYKFYGLTKEPSRQSFMEATFELLQCADKDGDDEYQRWINFAVQHRLMVALPLRYAPPPSPPFYFSHCPSFSLK